MEFCHLLGTMNINQFGFTVRAVLTNLETWGKKVPLFPPEDDPVYSHVLKETLRVFSNKVKRHTLLAV